MCNAYGLRAPVHLIVEAAGRAGVELGFEGGAAPNLEARDLIRPTETAPVIAPAHGAAGDGRGGAAVLVQRRWGFAPSAPKRPPVINFRSEGRRFRTGERVLAPVSHFFEYTGARSPKTRWRFTWADASAASLGADGEDEPLFAIAGVMRPAPANGALTSAGEPWPASWTMLTVDPGPDVAPIHDRQVVVLGPADWARWLFAPAEEAAALLAPSPAGALRVAQDR